MIAKIYEETIHGDVGLGADSAEWKYFESFDDLLQYADATEKEGGADGMEKVIVDSDRQHWTNGECITLFESQGTHTYLNGNEAFQRDTMVAFLIEIVNPPALVYATGDSGSVVAFSDGNHADTVGGDGIYEEETLDRESSHAFLEGMRNAQETLDTPEAYQAAYAEALEYACNCIPFEILDKYGDTVLERENALRKYVGDSK